ncbi:MAG: SDR family NAD(P)-dependent oxidoreductase [Pseudomonadales bacterium]|nr:SDR family NAD(P)-dependent oxidoreductase [Pseudomonadales bacterium]
MRSSFGKRSTAEVVTEGIDLRGKIALVTGVNSGIGMETMRVLALRGAHVIGTCRTFEKAETACASVSGLTTPMACELADLDSVRDCAARIKGDFSQLDIVIANAGIMALPKLEQAHGIELQFATNHLGHFLLVTSLVESLAEDARVVIVSSEAHRSTPKGGIEFDNLSGETGYSALRAYGQSKLANILFANRLAKQLEGRATVNSLHPGVIGTNLGRHIHPMLAWTLGLVMFPFAKTIPQGAATSCYVATAPELDNVSGRYFSDCEEKAATTFATSEQLADRLWTASENLVS